MVRDEITYKLSVKNRPRIYARRLAAETLSVSTIVPDNGVNQAPLMSQLSTYKLESPETKAK